MNIVINITRVSDNLAPLYLHSYVTVTLQNARALDYQLLEIVMKFGQERRERKLGRRNERTTSNKKQERGVSNAPMHT